MLIIFVELLFGLQVSQELQDYSVTKSSLLSDDSFVHRGPSCVTDSIKFVQKGTKSRMGSTLITQFCKAELNRNNEALIIKLR